MKSLMKYKALSPLLLAACTSAGAEFVPQDIRIDDTEVYPESLSAAADGSIYIGSTKGIIYRAEPGSDTAQPWIHHNEENGILALLGVMADSERNTLWVCSAPNFFGPERSEGVSSLIAFELDSGDFKARYAFPPPASVCNDISIADDGTVYATDTGNGRIFSLASGADELSLFGEDEVLVGVDGIAFSADGTLYVNNVQSNDIIRVEINGAGKMGELTLLELSHELGGPDGFRLIGGNTFIQAEGNIGRLSQVHIDDDTATLEVLRDDLISTPGATVYGDTAYVLESNIGYLLDPELQGQQPPAFMVYAVPLSTAEENEE